MRYEKCVCIDVLTLQLQLKWLLVIAYCMTMMSAMIAEQEQSREICGSAWLQCWVPCHCAVYCVSVPILDRRNCRFRLRFISKPKVGGLIAV